MEISRDISNHLFYTSWILLILQMGKIIGSTFYYGNFGVIVNIAFDCALLLFSIGLIRIGLEKSQVTHWKISSILFISAALLDIIRVILSLVFEYDIWILKPLIIVRLILIILYLMALILGFAYLKLFIDSLENLNIVNRRGRFLISVGHIILFYPYLVFWSGDWIYPEVLKASIENTSLIVFLIAAFVLILGFLELAFTMKILREGFVQEELEERSYKTEVEIKKKEEEIGEIDNE